MFHVKHQPRRPPCPAVRRDGWMDPPAQAAAYPQPMFHVKHHPRPSPCLAARRNRRMAPASNPSPRTTPPGPYSTRPSPPIHPCLAAWQDGRIAPAPPGTQSLAASPSAWPMFHVKHHPRPCPCLAARRNRRMAPASNPSPRTTPPGPCSRGHPRPFTPVSPRGRTGGSLQLHQEPNPQPPVHPPGPCFT
jgi:hypothetical protein